MPLYPLTYERFQGERNSRLSRSWALARTGLTTLLKQRRFLFLLAAGWVPAIIRGGQIYVARQFPDSVPFLDVGPDLWREFLSQQVTFLLVVIVALFAGAGSIASDLRFGAVGIYLAKPLTRMDYLLGKSLPVLLVILAITLVPGLTLLIFHLLLAENLATLREAFWLPFSIMGYSIWLAAYFTLTVLAISSLSRSRRLAAAGFVLVALGSEFFRAMASRITFGQAPPYLSLIRTTVDSSGIFFGTGSTSEAPLTSFVCMAFLMAGSVWVIDRRLRSTEVSS